MKKLLIGLLSMFLLMETVMTDGNDVKAASLSEGTCELTTTSNTLQVGDVVEVELRVHNMEIAGVSGYLSYDTEVFETPTVSDVNLSQEAVDKGWSKSLSNNGVNKLVLLSGDGMYYSMPNDGLVATVSLTLKKAVEDTWISLTTVEIDGKDNYYENGSATVDIGSKGDSQIECGMGIAIEGEMPSILKENDTFRVNVYFTSLPDYADTLFMGFSYNKSDLELVSVEGQNGWEITGDNPDYGENMFAITAETNPMTYKRTNEVILKTIFQVKHDMDNTNIQLMDINVAGSGVDFCENEVSNVLKVGGDVELGFELTSGTVSTSGQNISVPVEVKSNTGYNVLGLAIEYDDTILTYDSLELNSALQAKIKLDSVYKIPDMGNVKASFIALENIVDVGEFLNLNFKVNADVPDGTKTEVKIAITQIGNKEEMPMAETGTTIPVTITTEDNGGESGGDTGSLTLGDVNNDTKIDLIDAVYILQYYNEERVFDDKQEQAADVNLDGAANLVDALLIMKYFNGEITSFQI